MSRLHLFNAYLQHAYLLDHGDDREAYVNGFLEQLVSWDVVEARIERAQSVINFWEMPAPEDALVKPGEIAGRPFQWVNPV